MPLALVITVALPLKEPLAPLPGAVKVTETPWTREPAAFLTDTARVVAKAEFTVVDWLLPVAAVTVTGASSSAMVPVAVLLVMVSGTRLFSSTDTVALPMLATSRSGRPSPLTSPTATEKGLVPVAKVCWGAKDGVVAPGAVVFSSTDTVALRLLATRRSGRPSPLTSPTATELGMLPVAKVCWGAKEGGVAPGAVVVSSPDTVALTLLATRRSGRPSPLTSPTATELGVLPVAKVCWGAKEGVVAPAAVVFSSTDTVALP